MNTPNENDLKVAYIKADEKGKKMLASLYGKDAFAPIDQIKNMVTTFEQVLSALKRKSSDFAIPANGSNEQIAAAYMRRLNLIAKLFNDGWVADIYDTSQYKYWIWFKIDRKDVSLNNKSGFGFAYTDYYFDYSSTSVGSRPYFKTSDIAKYVGNTFTSEFENFAYYQQLSDREI